MLSGRNLCQDCCSVSEFLIDKTTGKVLLQTFYEALIHLLPDLYCLKIADLIAFHCLLLLCRETDYGYEQLDYMDMLIAPLFGGPRSRKLAQSGME